MCSFMEEGAVNHSEDLEFFALKHQCTHPILLCYFVHSRACICLEFLQI